MLNSDKINKATPCFDDEELMKECKELELTLPKRDCGGRILCQYKGFWFFPKSIPPIISFQRNFQAQETDIMVASKPKTGTTWLKSLVFAITKRALYPDVLNDHPLLSSNPHKLVPFCELVLYTKHTHPDWTQMPTPRLIATHLSYALLPQSIINSHCKIVYICRNPYDTFISGFHFLTSTPSANKSFSIDEYFDLVCEGVEPFGTIFEHVLDFWKQSRESPHKVLFLKYEDLKMDIVTELKKLALFLGYPFSDEETEGGVIEGIVKLCSFENMSELEVNKTGKTDATIVEINYKQFFRKGEVGDWVNYFTPAMVDRFDKLTEEKLGGSGLTFKRTLP